MQTCDWNENLLDMVQWFYNYLWKEKLEYF